MKRLLYLVYYIMETDPQKLKRFLRVARERTRKSSMSLLWEAVSDALRYNISVLDYFYFRFFERNSIEKNTYAGTGFMYEYQLRMNPVSSREVLENKIMFLEKFRPFVKRSFATFEQLKHSPGVFTQLVNNRSGKLVLKGSRGQIGAEVEVVASADFGDAGELLAYMKKNKFDLIEEFVIQHDQLMRISPSGLNTIRIITQIHQGRVIILGARLRITINSAVDNMAAGNIAAPVDVETGLVSGDGVYSDIAKAPVSQHPVTAVTIKGFQIPFWNEAKEMVQAAAMLEPHNRSVGWDVAISENGPQLIEGNHNWCKLLWQLPVKQGLKSQLLTFADA